MVNYLRAMGIRARLRPLERAAFVNLWQDRKVRHLLQGASGAFAFGSSPEIDDLFQQQTRELDRTKREALLHGIQRIAYERVMFAPIFQLAQLNGVRARVEYPSIGLINYLPYSSPYEDLRLKP